MPLQIWPISCPKAALESSQWAPKSLKSSLERNTSCKQNPLSSPLVTDGVAWGRRTMDQDCKKALPPGEGALGDFSHSVNTPVAAGTHSGLWGEPPLCCSYKSMVTPLPISNLNASLLALPAAVCLLQEKRFPSGHF